MPGKFHLPGLSPTSPLCGRQLNNHRSLRLQTSDKVRFASTLLEFTQALLARKACRHCAVASGLLVRTVTVREITSDDDDQDEGDDQ